MKSLVFPGIINVYDLILWRHINSSATKFMIQRDIWQLLAICGTVAKPVTRGIASSCFWNFAWKKFLHFFCKTFLGDPTFSSSVNVRPRSVLNFMTETKCYRQAIFSIVRIAWPGWLALRQFFIAINYIRD